MAVDMDVYQCYFDNCLPPPPVTVPPPPDSRPDTALRWSNTASWTDLETGWGSGENTLPLDDSNVMIQPGKETK